MNSAQNNAGRHHPNDTAPWWRQGWCWLVIVGPLAVVIASFYTMFIAYREADSLSPVYISEHHMHADRRIANSFMPAEDVSKDAVVHAPPARASAQ
jgi:hypothetical protein